MTTKDFVNFLGTIVVVAPLVLLTSLGVTSLLGRRLPERWILRLCQVAISVGLLASLAILGIMIGTKHPHFAIDFGKWVDLPHYHFSIKLLFDRLTIPMVVLTYLLCGTIGAFTGRYLHREPGFNRYFFLYSLFLTGMIIASLAANIELLYLGWEMVGLSSALLVSFFQERAAPPRNGLWVWTVYRVSDAALLAAAVAMHHMVGGGDFDQLMGGSWPAGTVSPSLTTGEAFLLGFLMLISAAGKSAMVPFSGWLPRAMEGPTPSSAVFYGALSVHLGVFLLLRIEPIIEMSWPLECLLIALGLSTAISADLFGRVQTDIKSALSFASLSQVGIIVVEIGFGWRYLAIIHMLGHACLRTLQFLRAPTFLQDSRQLENAIGGRLSHGGPAIGRWLSPAMNRWLYRWARERGYMDAILRDYIVRPVLGFFLICERLEQRWTNFVSGTHAPDAVPKWNHDWHHEPEAGPTLPQ